MKFTLSWLKHHLDTAASVADIAAALTRIGLEVESVDDAAAKLRGFTVALVIDASQHPNADRLRVCMVDTGSGPPVQVVCGAPNARTGMKSVFAPAGTYIPGKAITLGNGVIRGVESNGMLCSAAELELSNDHDGIIELPDDAPIGAAYADFAGLADPVFDVNVTPNRPDAASVHGIARDLAAAGLGTLKERPLLAVAGGFPCPVGVRLSFAGAERHLAPAFALRLVCGVRNGPSPEWMQRRLKAIGLRPINALVDITNYITFDHGRPLHVFDAGKVRGNLVVRLARPGEEIVALDAKTYMLGAETVVIVDDIGIESIAGIMGGQASGCDEATTDVLIESALWDAANIAASGRSLGINSDARYRFERGVDPAFCLPGLDFATELVLALCGGEASSVTLAGAIPAPKKLIDFPLAEVARLTGLELSHGESLGILERLGFAVEPNGDRAWVVAPSWRPDIEGKADLVEEVVRIAGLDRVQSHPLPRMEAGVPRPVLTLLQKRTRLARRALASRGLVEAVTWSFIAHDRALAFGGGAPALQLANPIAPDLSDMRPSLLSGLIAAAQRNADRGLSDLALFEVGQVFLGDGERGQRMNAAGLRCGAATPQGSGRHWSAPARTVTVHDAKADALALLSALGVPLAGMQIVAGGPAWWHPGRSGRLQFGPHNVIGAFGELHPRIVEKMGAEGALCGFEITLDAIPAPKAKPTKAKARLELQDLMPLTRDFAFVVDRAVRAGDILKAAETADRQQVAGVKLFDVYEGANIAPDKKSVAIEVTILPRDKTMTDMDISALSAKIVAEVAKKTGAVLRA